MLFKYAVVMAAVLFVTASGPVFSASLEELTGAEQAAALRAAAAPITETQSKKPSLRLIPRHEGLLNSVSGIMRDLDPGIVVETLSLVQPAETVQVDRLSLLNHLTALSTLTGIEYYSQRRHTMRLLYEVSQVIDNPDDKNPVPDPVFSELPASVELYAWQKDLTFGDNLYRFDYRVGADGIILVQENLTVMTAGIIPAVGKGRCRTIIAVIDAGDSLLVYTAAMAKTISLPGIGDRVGVSFTNRIIAILNWFNGRIGAR